VDRVIYEVNILYFEVVLFPKHTNVFHTCYFETQENCKIEMYSFMSKQHGKSIHLKDHLNVDSCLVVLK